MGSALLVCHDLVLTALHVAAKVDGVAEVFSPRPDLKVHFYSGAESEAELEAQDVKQDWALLRLRQPPAGITPVPLGRPPGPERLQWATLAYPRQAGAIGHDRMRLSGTLEPTPFDPKEFDGSLVYQLDVQELTSLDLAKGASGGPIIYDGLCLGVVLESQTVGGTLYGCPADSIGQKVPQLCHLLEPPPWLDESARTTLEPVLSNWPVLSWGGPPLRLQDPWELLKAWLRYPGGLALLLAALHERGDSKALEAFDKVRRSHVGAIELGRISSKLRSLRSDPVALADAFRQIQGNRPWVGSCYPRLLAVVEQLADHPAPGLQAFLEEYLRLSNQSVPGLFAEPAPRPAPAPMRPDLRVLFKPSEQEKGRYLLWIWYQAQVLSAPLDPLTFEQAFQELVKHLDDLPDQTVVHLHAPGELFFSLPGTPVANDFGSNFLANLRPTVLKPFDRLHKRARSLRPKWQLRWQDIAGSRPEPPGPTQVCWWIENPSREVYNSIINEGTPLAIWKHDRNPGLPELFAEASPGERLLERVHKLAVKFNLAVMWDDPQDSPDYLLEAMGN